ncbi:MAG: hypothetical protein R3336_04785, partial [Phycisphaeraceae bacterium]|nr:hypothetical protein [Phycisphaeraceae bacterium]
SDLTQHEPIQLIRGLGPADLPDRWHGYGAISTLVWTPQGGDPTDAAFSSAARSALRAWVKRGGHLVVVLPSVGQLWTDSSLSDLLPPVDIEPREGELPPGFLGQPVRDDGIRIRVNALWPYGDADVLLKGMDGDLPLVVTARRSLGRVTLIGVDLTAPALAATNLPSGTALWGAVLGRINPGAEYTKSFIDSQKEKFDIIEGPGRRHVELGRIVAPLIAMRDTVATALLLAIFTFVLYWLVAGPGSWFLLRAKGASRQSWLTFVAVIAVFAAVAWGGAWLARPTHARVTHLSVVDIDGSSGLMRAQSWLRIYVPRFGNATVSLPPHGEAATGEPTNTIASLGLLASDESGGFLSQRQYEQTAAVPSGVRGVPVRSTAKQFQINYAETNGPMAQQWGFPTGWVTEEDRWPVGDLTHNLPGALRHVLVVWSRGDGTLPQVLEPKNLKNKTWAPGQTLTLEKGPPMDRLVKPRRDYMDPRRSVKDEGYLGQLVQMQTGGTWANQPGQGPGRQGPMLQLADNELVQSLHVLSFFDRLPPPVYVRQQQHSMYGPGDRPLDYRRRLGRELDISHLVTGRCLMVIGHLPNSELPAPLRLDGDAVPSEGWTMVRWIVDVERP